MVKHTKFPVTVMLLEVMSNKVDVMSPHYFPQGLRVNSADYKEVLERAGWPWIKNRNKGRLNTPINKSNQICVLTKSE